MTRTPAPDAPVVHPIQLSFLPEFNALLAVDWWEHAHFVQTVGKVPTGPWRDVQPVYDEVREWTRAGDDHGAGVVPATITRDGKLRLTVVDVDHGDAAELVTAYAPLAVVPSRRRGGRHLYFVDDDTRPSRKFQWRGCSGDVRSEGGYVVCHGNAIEIVDHALAGVCRNARKPRLFPAHLVGDAVAGRRTTRTRGRSAPVRSLMLSEALAAAKRLGPFTRLSSVAEGGRHDALVSASLRWAGRRTWNGRKLTETEIATGCIRLALGLSGEFPDDEALGIVGWALRCRRAWAALGWQSTDEYRATQARRVRTRFYAQPELFADRIASILKLHSDGLTQVEIAHAVDCSQPTVSRILMANRTAEDQKYSYQ